MTKPPKKRHRWVDTLYFWRAFLTNPFSTGAIAPSSPYLARRIIANLPLQRANAVVEVGPGTGAITAAILEKLGDNRKYIGIDLNPSFIDGLRRRFPETCFILGSAEHLKLRLAELKISQVDYVVSALPWTLFNPTLQHTILTEISETLGPSGEFTTFTYVHSLWLPSWRRFRGVLSAHFKSITRSSIIWANLPPAVVYHCKNT